MSRRATVPVQQRKAVFFWRFEMEKLEQAAVKCIDALADYVKADGAGIAINPRKRQALIAITLMQNALEQNAIESASSKVPWEKAYEKLRGTAQMVYAITKSTGE